MEFTSFDFETELIGVRNLAPKPICISTWSPGVEEPTLIGNGDGIWSTAIHSLFRDALDDGHTLVAHSAAFDCIVAHEHFSHLRSTIFELYARGQIICTEVLEKLLQLTDHGSLTFLPGPQGVQIPARFGLASLVSRYLGVDVSSEKEGEDAVRMRYTEMDGRRAEEYPDEFYVYAALDAQYAGQVFLSQLEHPCFEHVSEDALQLHTCAAYALMHMTAEGCYVDNEMKERVREWVEREIDPDNLKHLVSCGYLTPAQPPRPYASGAKDADGNPKMTKPTKEKFARKKFRELVKNICVKNDVPIKYTDSGQVSTDAEVLEQIWMHDPVLEEYVQRNRLLKLRDTEIPRMGNEGIVHFNYDVLKETSRTSSYSVDHYPSANGQNIHRLIRECYIAGDGNVINSSDYDGLELCTLADRIYSIFGESKLLTLINEGKDLHAFLGAQLAFHLASEFRAAFPETGEISEEFIYQTFLAVKKENPDFFKKWRTFAKPTGLGYPGGLGPKTFVSYARAIYKIEVSYEMAKRLRELYFEIFPEVKLYLEWTTKHCKDERHPLLGTDEDTGRDIQGFVYISPLGTRRPSCTFTACANGNALQTPAAEGAKLAVWGIVRAAKDPAMADHILHGTHPFAFVHDEILNRWEDDERSHDRALATQEIMVDSMNYIRRSPVRFSAASSLMRRWSKKAEPVFDSAGRLQVWEPKDGTAKNELEEILQA